MRRFSLTRIFVTIVHHLAVVWVVRPLVALLSVWPDVPTFKIAQFVGKNGQRESLNIFLNIKINLGLLGLLKEPKHILEAFHFDHADTL